MRRPSTPRARPGRAAWTALGSALVASGCSLLLDANHTYYEIAAGGASATSSGSSASSASASSTASASSSGSSGGVGGEVSTGTTATASASSSSSASGTGGSGGGPPDTCWHGAPADPGGVDPCGAGTIAALSDDFNDNMVGPLWVTYEINATAVEMNQQAVVSIPGAPNKFAGYVSTTAYSLLGCHAAIEVVQSPQHASTVLHFSLSPDPSSGADLLEAHQIGKSLVFTEVVGGVATDDCTLPYDPIAHRFWRIREKGGQVLWETAPDGKTWTVRREEPAPGFASAVRLDFGVIPIAADVAGVGIFDNFDVP